MMTLFRPSSQWVEIDSEGALSATLGGRSAQFASVWAANKNQNKFHV